MRENSFLIRRLAERCVSSPGSQGIQTSTYNARSRAVLVMFYCTRCTTGERRSQRWDGVGWLGLLNGLWAYRVCTLAVYKFGSRSRMAHIQIRLYHEL
jgi:hypothetical protein